MQIVDEWLKELPQQFQNKNKIEVLIKAFSRQLEEIYNTFERLKTETDLETATAANLDVVGDILTMSRKQATEILRQAKEAEVTDETYRQVLKYTKLKNTSECTYEDIIESIELLWDTSNIKYSEEVNRPATICLNLPNVDIEGIDPAINRVLAIRPAGVAIIYVIGYLIIFLLAECVNLPLIEIAINIKNIEQVKFNAVSIHSQIIFNETIKGFLMKDTMWYLDGTYLLDGTKKLNADVIKEEL